MDESTTTEQKEFLVTIGIMLYGSSQEHVFREAQHLAEGLGDSEQTLASVISVMNTETGERMK